MREAAERGAAVRASEVTGGGAPRTELQRPWSLEGPSFLLGL